MWMSMRFFSWLTRTSLCSSPVLTPSSMKSTVCILGPVTIFASEPRSSSKPGPKKPWRMPAETFTSCSADGGPSGKSSEEGLERRTLRPAVPKSLPKRAKSSALKADAASDNSSTMSWPLAASEPATSVRFMRCSAALPRSSSVWSFTQFSSGMSSMWKRPCMPSASSLTAASGAGCFSAWPAPPTPVIWPKRETRFPADS
mmetsp:Transcript_18414/g.52051  ORF Transcript_18414/g.52051 Transcript_18414/m.52051 type:complete len:201 (-) Transcript_18414:147-749(-)